MLFKDPDSNQFLLREIYNNKSSILTAFKKVVSTVSGEKRCRFKALCPSTSFILLEDQAAVEDAAEYLSERFGS